MKKFFLSLIAIAGLSSLVLAATNTASLLGTTAAGAYTGALTFTLVDQFNVIASLIVQNLTASGNLTVGGNVAVTGNETVNGINTIGGFNVYTSSAITIAALSYQITPNATYILLQPNTLAANGALTATPTISTSTLGPLGGPAFADGSELIVQSTGTTAIELQDNGTLSGSQLFLGRGLTYTTVSSSMTARFIYNATEKGWNFIGR